MSHDDALIRYKANIFECVVVLSDLVKRITKSNTHENQRAVIPDQHCLIVYLIFCKLVYEKAQLACVKDHINGCEYEISYSTLSYHLSRLEFKHVRHHH